MFLTIPASGSCSSHKNTHMQKFSDLHDRYFANRHDGDRTCAFRLVSRKQTISKDTLTCERLTPVFLKQIGCDFFQYVAREVYFHSSKDWVHKNQFKILKISSKVNEWSKISKFPLRITGKSGLIRFICKNTIKFHLYHQIV